MHVCVCVCAGHSVVSDSLRSHGWTLALQAPLSMGFSRQKYWKGLSVPSPEMIDIMGQEVMLAFTGDDA